MKKRSLDIYKVVSVALFVALLSITSFIVIPIPFSFVPITLQTIVINIIAIRFKTKEAMIIIFLYMLLGILGVPVFGGSAGIGKLLSPAGGYYIGFILSVFVMSMFKKYNLCFKNILMILLFVGMPIQHGCAVGLMLFYNSFDIVNAFLTISVPFILGDAIKCIISSFILTKLTNIIKQN